MWRDFLADIDCFVEGLRQRRIFDDRNLMLDRSLANSEGKIILSFGNDHGSGHAF